MRRRLLVSTEHSLHGQKDISGVTRQSESELAVTKAKASIEVQESNAILTVTLSRPDHLNILDLETRG